MDNFFFFCLLVALTILTPFTSSCAFADPVEDGIVHKQYVDPSQVRIYTDEIQVVLDREIVLVDRIFSDQAGVYFFTQETRVPPGTWQCPGCWKLNSIRFTACQSCGWPED